MNHSSFLEHSQSHPESFLNQSNNNQRQPTQYQLLYQDMSHIRIQLRATKHDNTCLRSSLQGTQDQNATLKHLLSDKKALINKLNCQIRESNQEINRLQDYKCILMSKNEELLALNVAWENRVRQCEDVVRMEVQEKRLMQGKCGQLLGQGKRYKQMAEKMQRMSKQEHSKSLQDITKLVNLQIQSILQRIPTTNHHLDHPPSDHHEQRNRSNNQQQHISRSKISHQLTLPSTKSNITQRQDDMGCSIVMSFESRLSAFKSSIQQRWLQQQTLLHSKQHQINAYRQKMVDLQSQLSQSMELFEQQLREVELLKGKLRESQMASAQAQKGTRERKVQRQQLLKHANRKLLLICEHTMLHCNLQLFARLKVMMEQPNSKRFELQVLLRQIENVAEQNFKEAITLSLNNQNLQKLMRQYNDVSEEYELILLKYSTLQRQYHQVVDDNRRLIKFNHLSKFRLSRNHLSPNQPQENHNREPQKNNKTPAHHLKDSFSRPSLKENLPSTLNI